MVDRNKKLAILSNTSSPSKIALDRLKKYGLRKEMFAGGLVSSGEECARYVRETYASCTSADICTKALWLTWNESEKQSPIDFLQCCETENVQIDIAESVDDADFVLLHGSEVLRRYRSLKSLPQDKDGILDLNFLYNQDFSVIDPILTKAVQKKLPMVCANPDLIVTLQGGVVGNMPGQIAQRYEQMGGKVIQFGKPNPRHFISCLRNLKVPAENESSVAHVGDSLEHDVAGANAAGIDSVFVLGGIHAQDLGLAPTTSDEAGIKILDDEVQGKCIPNSITKSDLTLRLQQLFAERGIQPTHVVPSLSL